MPEFVYQGRDKEGHLRVGQRFAETIDVLNSELIKEGIYPIKITPHKTKISFLTQIRDWFQGEAAHLEELVIFSRQMQLLQKANIPLTTSLKQLGVNARSQRLVRALRGVIEYLEKGQSLATAMQYYPDAFSPLMINIIQIGETTGHLSEAFANIHQYLEFESRNLKQFKSAFRYPLFVVTTIVITIIVLNVFVIPNFARFYLNMSVALPWQTRLLIGMSNLFIKYGIFLVAAIIGISFLIYRYLRTPKGLYRWHYLQLRIPILGPLLKRLILIRFSQSLAVTLKAGISVMHSLTLVKNLLQNSYVNLQITEMQESISRGNQFTQAINKIKLLTQLELQILSVGEKNGELGLALDYIANFHTHEIEYDLKRINDLIGPILIGIVSVLILIIAMGVYLPIWNMINLTHT